MCFQLFFIRFSAILSVLVSTAASSPAQVATEATRDPVPSISATARGEVTASPDRASIRFAVETRAATAQAASTENATKQTAVIQALRGAGLSGNQVSTIGYSLTPEMYYDPETRQSRLVGYVARNTVLAEVHDLDDVGEVIDVAIAAGANNVDGLNFSTTREEALRREALAAAMVRACQDASAIAAAGGGMLGALLHAETAETQRFAGEAMMMRAQAGDASTPIAPGDLSIQATVSARWRFVATGTPGADRCE